MQGLKVVSAYNRYLNRGGEDEVFESEARLLDDYGCHVRLVTDRTSPPPGLKEKITFALNTLWSRSWYVKFQGLLNDFKPHLVHVHNAFPVMSPSIYYACRRAGVPVVQTLHNYRLFCPAATFFREGKVCEECVEHTLWRGVRYGCYHNSRPQTATVAMMLALHRWRRTWAEEVDRYIALTEFAREKFIACGLPADKISVKPNFVQRDPGASDGTGEYGLFVGRLAPYKGVKTLLSAWERLSTRVPLLIVGDGPLREELEARVAQSRLYCVEFRGRLPHNATQEVIKGARFLILPSQCYETFSMSIVEAFACATPVICSRLGAMQELVADGRTGLHFAPGDAADLAQKADWAWNHPDEMKALGQEARAEYERRYTAARNYRMLMEIYQRAIAALPQNT